MLRADGDAVGLTTASPDKKNPDADTSGEAFVKHIKRMFGFLEANTSLTEERMRRMSIPQLQAHYEVSMRYKIGPHGMIGDEKDKTSSASGGPSTMQDLMDIAAAFNGVGG